MAERLSPPRGTRDVLPEEWSLRGQVVAAAARRFAAASFGRITTPTFEDTALFARGVGEHTDVVSKEMYTFQDRSERSLTLRPEGTAPVVRAYISHGMHRRPQPVRVWYHAPMFRYEKPQEGRYREHYQLGGEIFGAAAPAADAEVIGTLAGIYADLGLDGVGLRLNTIGDSTTRPAYRDALVDYLRPHLSGLPDDARVRAEANPMRLFDAKDDATRAVMADAPRIRDSVSVACAEHFAAVCELLDAAGITYTLDDTLVRGFDYYTHTTFEFTAPGLGAQDAIGGGGRYDGLVELLGGPATPAVGFGAGIERIVLAMQAAGAEGSLPGAAVFVGADSGATAQAFSLAQELRDAGVHTQLDLAGRSRNGQIKAAQKAGAVLAAVVQEDGVALVRLRGHEESIVAREQARVAIQTAVEEAWDTEATSAPR